MIRFWGSPGANFRSSKIILTKARLLKHYLHFHGLKGAERKQTLQKHPFGQPFLRTTPSPLLRGAPINHTGAKTKFSGPKGGDKGGGEEEKRGKRGDMACRGKGGENEGKRVARKHARKTQILVPFWFRYSLVAFGIASVCWRYCMSNGISMRIRQKQKCATSVWKTSKTRYTPVNEIENCQHFLKSPFLKHLKNEIHACKTRLHEFGNSLRRRSYLPPQTQNLFLRDPVFVALRFESRDWRSLV